jgi:hypothetical protein
MAFATTDFFSLSDFTGPFKVTEPFWLIIAQGILPAVFFISAHVSFENASPLVAKVFGTLFSSIVQTSGGLPYTVSAVGRASRSRRIWSWLIRSQYREREDCAFVKAPGGPFPLACGSDSFIKVWRLHPAENRQIMLRVEDRNCTVVVLRITTGLGPRFLCTNAPSTGTLVASKPS